MYHCILYILYTVEFLENCPKSSSNVAPLPPEREAVPPAVVYRAPHHAIGTAPDILVQQLSKAECHCSWQLYYEIIQAAL